ncbi:response regulator [Rhizobium sp. VS19-DR104.2]|uniref:response regulator n=1 Tax=unclassified Rhizobium TaxID=2613769 RepID=UPI001C5B65AB|nr:MULTISPECIES: response regulator [unclassified Rhizobium]MBZ5763087.1 response regulator [Rhizobium sp. VS19-DR96]MBZ5768963.1 response regulator [Rhizobium sp. VS19-DR129.2]MBZ5776581.1 response regulator [Rhizobium sp. VS19-DRK62.2]MBZ5787680.1 response regulator [Rhizobium sp. VS19-DR121]MBZ5805053.1 response regulator [Rhizobium sp. VS19-DR181]
METAEFEQLVKPIALVVDDEPLILLDTADMISDEGYTVVEASTADQAFAFLDRLSSLQLLFTDVQMPGDLDGFGLARIVAERWPHIHVEIASGAIVPGPGDLSANAKFIRKPFTAELVHQTLVEHGFSKQDPDASI